MVFNRSQNAKKNVVAGIVNKAAATLLPFILRTAMIRILGYDYLGLNSLFSSILEVLNLAELGFSEAIVYSMYKPIAENDHDKVCALLNLYRKIYLLVGCVIFAAGLAIMPALPHLIKESYPAGINLYVLFFIYLFNTCLSYWVFAYKVSLLQAFQRNDIVSRTDTAVRLLLNLTQLAVLLLFRNYYVYLIIMPVCTLINNLYLSHVVNKRFPGYVCKGLVDRREIDGIRHNVVGVAISKVCNTTRNSLDSIFTSAFIGLKVTAIYNNYYYACSAMASILSILVAAISSVVGNSIATEPVEKNYQDMCRLNFVYMWLGSWTTTCLFCLMQPFMILWVGDDLLFDQTIVGLFCAYYFALKSGDVQSIYVQGSGLYWQQRFRALGESMTNVILNWVLVQYFGVAGIVSATLISLIIFNSFLSVRILFRDYYKGITSRYYYLQTLGYAGITFIITAVVYLPVSMVSAGGIGGFLLKLLICMVLPNLLWILIYKRTRLYRESLEWMLDIFHLNMLKKILL